MDDLIVEWTINVVNFLIYILIFTRAIITKSFNTFDLFATLIGILAGVTFLVFKVIKNKKENE